METLELPSYIGGGSLNDTTTLENGLAVSHTTWSIIRDPAVTLLGIHLKELTTYGYTKTYTQLISAALPLMAKEWKHPNVHHLMNGLNSVSYPYSGLLFGH